MLGRNGALILGDIPTALHVQVTRRWRSGSPALRARRGSTEAQAARRQRSEDRVRAEMSERFYHWNPMDPR